MSRRLALFASLLVVTVLVAALAVPALGGPSVPQLAKKVSRALKLAKAADKRSKKALKLAQRAGQDGTSGTDGPNGTTGTTGAPGPPGPPGPSGATKLDFRATAPAAPTEIFNHGGLVLTARCDPGPSLAVDASTTVDHAELHIGSNWDNNGTPTALYNDVDDFHPGQTHSVTGNAANGNNLEGTLTYSTAAGSVVTVTFAAEEGAFGQTDNCWFAGWALHDPGA